MKKKEFWIVVIILSIVILTKGYKQKGQNILQTSFEANPKFYYQQIKPKQKNLRQQLNNLISKQKKISYHQVWSAFEQLDITGNCGRGIEDIYSSNCWLPGNRRRGGQQCNKFVKKEGKCYNREHSWPKSWWGGSNRFDSFTDLHHLFPTDGYVNFRRGNLPFGEVISPITYESTNGAKIGRCRHNPRRKCFEPHFQYKGDLARVYFYMSVRYMKTFRCCIKEGIKKWKMDSWLLRILKKWHVEDPVSPKERIRNDKIYMIQGNRNPFVDNPTWVKLIKFD